MKQSQGYYYELRAELDRWYGYIDQLGKPIDANVTTVGGQDSSRPDHLGKVPVIVYHTVDHVQRAGAYRGVKKWLRVFQRPSETTSLIVALGDRRAQTAKESLPGGVYLEASGDRKLSRQFAVRAVPRYVLIDHTGKVAAVGGAMIGDELDRLIAAAGKDAKKAIEPAASDAPSSD